MTLNNLFTDDAPATRPLSDFKFVPSAQLCTFTEKALRELHGNYRNLMPLVFDSSIAGADYHESFAYALRYAALDLIPLAVKEWLAGPDCQYPPQPGQLGEIANRLTQARQAALHPRHPNAPVEPSAFELRSREVVKRIRVNQDAASRELLTACAGNRILSAVVAQVLLKRAQEQGVVDAYRLGDWPPLDELHSAVEEGRTLDPVGALGTEFYNYLTRKHARGAA